MKKTGSFVIRKFIVTAVTCVALGLFSSLSEANEKGAAERLQTYVTELASDKYEGRGAGYPGELAAAHYIADQFRKIGLVPIHADLDGVDGYLQSFDIHMLESPIPWQVQTSQNVVGVLRGTAQAGEAIVIGAHYDGQGMEGQALLGREVGEGSAESEGGNDDSIWNSAVDNAVSIASILEIAEQISQPGVRPGRTVIFVAFGAEESALDGSAHYAEHTLGTKSGVKAMLNVEKLVGDTDAELLYVSYDSSPIFPTVRDVVVEKSGINLHPFYPGVIANTDHYPFYMRNVPAVTIGTGSVENVHLATDHASAIDYELLAQRTDFVREFLLELASVDDQFIFAGDTSGKLGATGGPATVEELRIRGYDVDAGFKVAAIISGSPADQAGLIPGDLIVAVNDVPIQRQTYYQGLEDLLEDDDGCGEVRLTVGRRNMRTDISIDGGACAESD